MAAHPQIENQEMKSLHFRWAYALAAVIAVACGASGCGNSASQQSGINSSGVVRTHEITTKSGFQMVLIPGSPFMMGSDGAEDESPKHEVFVSPFAMDRYELTQDILATLEIPNPSHFKGPRRPIEQIRWSEAAVICNERSKLEGLEPCYNEDNFECNFNASGYRLPTEAEWEYAARAGSTTDFPFRDRHLIKSHICYAGNSANKTDLVGQKKPNAFGLYDMQGNVAEWCNDIYGSSYYAHSETSDPRGPKTGKKRVLRGGSWKSKEDACRVSARSGDNPGIPDACFARDTYGFRCVRRLTADELKLLEAVKSNANRGEQN